MRRMLTAKLQNRSGVLNRFTGVLSRRQVNIESISVGATENPDVSRITIIIDVNSHNEVEQIIKQLNRQIDVIRIRDITDVPHLEREVILVKVSAPTSKRAEILAIIQPFRASVVDVAPSSITIQMTGDAERVRRFYELFDLTVSRILLVRVLLDLPVIKKSIINLLT